MPRLKLDPIRSRNLQNDFRFCRVGGTVYIVGSH